MGLFGRFKSLIRGYFASLTGRLEEQNPELLIEDAQVRIDKSRKEAEKQLIEIQTWSEMIRLDLKAAERDLIAVRERIAAATEHRDRELLIELIMQEEECTARYDERKNAFDSAVAEALRVRDQFKQFESEMNARLKELHNIKSQVRLARMKENINNLSEKYGFGGANRSDINDSMDKLRNIVNLKTARANAVESLKEENITSKIQKLDRKVARDKASLKADELLNKKNDGKVEVNEGT